MGNRWRPLRMALAAVAVAGAAVMSAWTPASALECEGVVLDAGCLFTITGSDTPDPDDGYAVTNAHGAPFYDFIRARGLQSIGYPISHRWASEAFTFQAFQKAILQWDPGVGRMSYYNTLDALANRYPEVELPNVPPHQVIEPDGDGDFASVMRAHLALLDENAAIKERFLREPAWLSLYGLPISYQAKEVNGHPQGLQLLRTQRTVFEVWNVAAPGVTVGQVNLQNIPDKVKRLDDVIIPNTAKSLRKASDPDYPAIIANLYWVADGLTPLEQEGVAQLERIFAESEPMLRDWIYGSWFIRNQYSQRKARNYKAMARHAEQPWVSDGINSTEERLFGKWGSNATDVPDLAVLALQKPWIADGLIDDEVEIIHDLMKIGVNERLALVETNPGSDEPTIAYYLLQMPFLNSIEPIDVLAIRSLYRVGWAHRHEQHSIVAHYAQQGGITDDHAKMMPVTAYVAENEPELLNTYLDPATASVEERSIVLPHTGPVTLAVIRTKPGDEDTMTYLEEAVRFSEGFIRRPLPTSYIVLHVSEIVEPWGGLFLGSHVGIREAYDDPDHDWNEHLRGIVHHEVSHYYWHKGPSWLSEGGADFFVLHAGARGTRAGLKGLAHECRSTTVHDVTPERAYECRNNFGVELFFDLYHSLGEEEFLRGLWRLHDSTHGDLAADGCEESRVGACQLRFAFVTDAPLAAGALVEGFLRELQAWGG